MKTIILTDLDGGLAEWSNKYGYFHGSTSPFFPQIISPITNSIIGRHEIRVSKSKESITKLEARILSGIHMELSTVEEKGDYPLYRAIITQSNKLTSKYQVYK